MYTQFGLIIVIYAFDPEILVRFCYLYTYFTCYSVLKEINDHTKKHLKTVCGHDSISVDNFI